MEEDIKILEEFAEYSQDIINDMEYERPVDVTIYQKELIALENLIKGYRKLKLENQALENTQQNCPMMNTSGFQCEHKVEDITHIVNKAREDFVKQYIPKTKIKKKIEELENEYKMLEQTSDFIIADTIQPKIEVLQELLEEE